MTIACIDKAYVIEFYRLIQEFFGYQWAHYKDVVRTARIHLFLKPQLYGSLDIGQPELSLCSETLWPGWPFVLDHSPVR